MRCPLFRKSQQLFERRVPRRQHRPGLGPRRCLAVGGAHRDCVWGMPRRRATAYLKALAITPAHAWVRTQLLPEAEGALADTTNSKQR